MVDIKFYIKRDDVKIDIEAYYNKYDDKGKLLQGVLYSKCDGLFDVGKRLDVHTESYADSNEMRVWLGSEVVRDRTEIVLTLYFIGPNRKAAYESFLETVSNSKLYYWDTARLKLAYIFLKDAVAIKEDVHKGSTPYIMCEFKFQNMWGECKDCDINGNIKLIRNEN